jgi:hypothetical protein
MHEGLGKNIPQGLKPSVYAPFTARDPEGAPSRALSNHRATSLKNDLQNLPRIVRRQKRRPDRLERLFSKKKLRWFYDFLPLGAL